MLCCALLCLAVLCYAERSCAVFCSVVLCCIVSCHAVLCCAMSCCVVLCCVVLCCAVLCCVVLCCVVLCGECYIVSTPAPKWPGKGERDAGVMGAKCEALRGAGGTVMVMPRGSPSLLAAIPVYSGTPTPPYFKIVAGPLPSVAAMGSGLCICTENQGPTTLTTIKC